MNQTKFLVYFVAFLILQPIIDVLTAASILLLNLNITFGTVIRFLYMALSGVFLIYMARKSKLSKWYVFYLIGLAIMIVVNIALNMNVKEPYYLFQELKFFNKVVYFNVVFLGLVIIYKQLKGRSWDIEKNTTKYIWLAGIIIGAVFIISHITGTSLPNYAYYKEGYSGWFFAGNEIGAIMAIILPIVALYAIERTDNAKKPWQWIPFVMVSLGMLALGTKVGYGGVLIVLLSVLIGSGIMMIFMKLKTKQVKANLMISFVLTLGLMLVTPFTPVFGNMYAHLDLLDLSFGNAKNSAGDDEPKDDDDPEVTKDKLENLVFSSREKYLADFKKDFNSSPISQKLFGMGFAGNYEEPEEGKDLKMIEMDFHDLFFAFGWIGFIYLIIPMAYYAIKYIIHFIRNIKTHFTYIYILYGVGFLLGMGIAFTAGHVLTAPSVSIYLAVILAMLVVRENLIDTK